MPGYILKTKHINSKTLMKEVAEFISSIIDDFNITWTSDSQRDALLEVIYEYLQDMFEEGKIERWDVICDSRNNKKTDKKSNITHLDVKYTQHNCYNVSELNYFIEK